MSPLQVQGSGFGVCMLRWLIVGHTQVLLGDAKVRIVRIVRKEVAWQMRHK